jgi:hypothetical protein
MKTIYAGLDVDARAALFRIRDGEPVPIKNEEWCAILDELGARMGELVTVHLERDPDTLFD